MPVVLTNHVLQRLLDRIAGEIAEEGEMFDIDDLVFLVDRRLGSEGIGWVETRHESYKAVDEVFDALGDRHVPDDVTEFQLLMMIIEALIGIKEFGVVYTVPNPALIPDTNYVDDDDDDDEEEEEEYIAVNEFALHFNGLRPMGRTAMELRTAIHNTFIIEP